ncbi:MAG: alpha/beta hydrolase-fold protein [Anaerolineales bacterium]|nr:alpha/beta hydrolase-fold protein [Anaerolineales bacterium]MCX7754331.1 alpha/beta hydrolase-fold protein [Anaerolineales bacterium]MDW8279066.1 alpha/beta hydrolase-fold protein [Anaerolineales bacterium]
MKSHNPIITGNTVTLTWHGEQAPYLLSDLHGWEEHPQPFQAVDKGGWAVSFELPLNAYLEYAFYDPQTKQRLPDPLNRKRVYNGVGGWNHFFYMPEAQPTPWLKPPSGGLRGQITRYTVTAERVTASKARRVWLYRPPGNDPLPLLLVYDGEDYLRRGKLAVIVDNLIAARRIRPLAIAFVQNGGAARMVEYSQADSTLLFVMRQILPLAACELNLVDYEKHPGVHGVLGASMGGLMAVFTALCLPFVFGKAISQAGAFALWQQETVTMQMVRYFPKPDVQLWLDCGVMDFLREPNRRMAALLSEKGYRATYRENGGAHNYTTWRNACVEALETLFG